MADTTMLRQTRSERSRIFSDISAQRRRPLAFDATILLSRFHFFLAEPRQGFRRGLRKYSEIFISRYYFSAPRDI